MQGCSRAFLLPLPMSRSAQCSEVPAQSSTSLGTVAVLGCGPCPRGWVGVGVLTEDAVLMDLTAASNTFFGSRRLVVPLSTMLLS